MDTELVKEEAKRAIEPLIEGFIPKLIGKKVIIHLTTGGQPVTGTVERYNPDEILLQTARGKLLVFKHAIATIGQVDEPMKGFTI